MLYIQHPNRVLIIFFIPLLWAILIPLLICDISIEMYHRIFFPLYKIPYIKRNAYIQIMDRNKLPYLTPLQKINCMYCGYANGVIRYWAKIAGDTEHYWCGIQHKKNTTFISEEHQANFAAYGDKSGFMNIYTKPWNPDQ